MASRKLVVEIIGDNRSLDRAMKRSTKQAQTFSGQMDKSARSVQGFSRGLVGGFAGAAAFNVLISGLKDVIGLAAESQQILGQTSVAVKSAGFSWEQYGQSIQSAIQAQSKLGFDDEALMQSFGLFIRTSDSVSEALRRNQIAMDISRARFVDLETAANLVNKAALGQAGALRRVGIDARNGASGVELLTMLEQQFGGAAQAASTDAATAMDRFRVSAENAKEAIGTQLLPMMGTLLDSATAVADAITDIRGAVENLNGLIADIGVNLHVDVKGAGARALFALIPGSEQLADAVGALRQRARENAPPPRVRGESAADKVPRPPAGPTPPKPGKGATVAQRNAWFDARIAREINRAQDLSASKQRSRLAQIAKEVRARLAITKDATRRLTLEDQLLDITRQMKSAHDGVTKSIKEGTESLKDRAQTIKSLVLERLQRKQTDILNKRAMDEAKEQLRVARMIGTPTGIKAALQNVQDVQFDMLRARIENAPATLGGGKFGLGGVITININGITDPEAVAKKVAEVLQRRTKRTTTQMRGPAAGAAA